MNWNSPKLLTGFFIFVGVLLFAVVLYELISIGRFNYKAVLFGLVMFYFAKSASNKKNLG